MYRFRIESGERQYTCRAESAEQMLDAFRQSGITVDAWSQYGRDGKLVTRMVRQRHCWLSNPDIQAAAKPCPNMRRGRVVARFKRRSYYEVAA